MNTNQSLSWHQLGISLTLSAYSYLITYKPGDNNSNADVSYLPLPDAPLEVPLSGETILLMETLLEPMSAKQDKGLDSSRPTIVISVTTGAAG